MTRYSFLTTDELINQMTLRTDLTDLERELLDRLAECSDYIERLEKEIKYPGEQGFGAYDR